MKIKGKVKFQQIGPGFWGIVGQDGQNWRPVNMPEQLKKEDAQVVVQATEMKNQASLFMWGTAIKITGFQTLTP